MTNKPNALPVVAWEVCGAGMSLQMQRPDWAYSEPRTYTVMELVKHSDATEAIARRDAELAELHDSVGRWKQLAHDKHRLVTDAQYELTTLRARLAELEQQKPGPVGFVNAEALATKDAELAELREQLAAATDKIDKAWNASTPILDGYIPGALDAWKRPVKQNLPYDFSGNPDGLTAIQYCNGWNDSGGYWKRHVNGLDAELTTLRARLAELEQQKPVARLEVIDRHEGPYVFLGKELLDSGVHQLYAAPLPAPSQVADGVVQVLVESEKLISQMADRLEEDDALGDYDKELEQAYSLLSRLIVLNRAQPEVANNTGSRDMATLIRQDQAFSLGVEDVASTDEAPKADVMRVPVELLTRICVKRTYIPGSLVVDKAINELRALLATSQEGDSK